MRRKKQVCDGGTFMGTLCLFPPCKSHFEDFLLLTFSFGTNSYNWLNFYFQAVNECLKDF